MIKKFLPFVLTLALCMAALPLTALADTTSGFGDIPEGAWYAGDVKTMADAGIIDGIGNNLFAPNQNVTVAETIKLAATIHAKLTESEYDFAKTSPWYKTYEDYLAQADSFPDTTAYNHNAAANRDLFAKIMHGALAALPETDRSMNTVHDGVIPDIPDTDSHLYIYELYRAGIVVGNDSLGAYNPNSNILRSEAAAIANRFITPSARKTITLEVPPANNIGSNISSAAYVNEVLRLCNNIRTSRGLVPFTLNDQIGKLADLKASDMSGKNYFSHQSPTYGSPFNMLKANGVSYSAAAENIAKGYYTPQSVVDAWMESDSHKANILSSKYTQMGVGYDANGHYWSQIFIKP